jgi:PKD repeat protein
MVNTNHQEAVMSTKRTIRKSIALASLALALPVVAGAAPPVNDDPQAPFDPAPVARLTVTPNPALYSPEPVLTQARAFPGADAGAGGFGRGDLVKFDGSASSDNSAIVKYEFDLDGNGTYEVSGANPRASRRYAAIGTYTVKLRVTDDANKIRVITKELIVHAPPKAVLKASADLALVGQSITFNGGDSTDADGIVKYELDLDENGTYETLAPSASAAFTTLGEHTVRLRVTDGHGATSTAASKVTVHRAPTAAFTFDPNPGVAGEPMTFDGSTSGDDGTIAKYEWDLDGDGTYETDTLAVAKATTTFAAPGTFTVRLRVTDDHGVQDAVSHQVTVNPKPEVTVEAADIDAPLVKILSNTVKLRRTGNVLVRVTCQATDPACTGRLVLRAQGRRIGRKAFSLAAGQTTVLKVRVTKKARAAIKRNRRLSARAIATATDAAGNTATTRKAITIKR